MCAYGKRDKTSLKSIYMLRCPDTMDVKYIGSTINMENRYAQHVSNNEWSSGAELKNWIKLLKKQKKLPIMEEIETVSQDLNKEREFYWIQYYYQLTGGKILNTRGTAKQKIPNPNIIRKA